MYKYHKFKFNKDILSEDVVVFNKITNKVVNKLVVNKERTAIHKSFIKHYCNYFDIQSHIWANYTYLLLQLIQTTLTKTQKISPEIILDSWHYSERYFRKFIKVLLKEWIIAQVKIDKYITTYLNPYIAMKNRTVDYDVIQLFIDFDWVIKSTLSISKTDI